MGTFGVFGVLSFNGNKMITTSGGGALICDNVEMRNRIMYFATQARESYPYYQHTDVGYNYRMSNICAGIGRGQMTILDEHIAHHQRLAACYREAFKNVEGVTFHDNPTAECDSNFWLNTILLSPEVKVKRLFDDGFGGYWWGRQYGASGKDPAYGLRTECQC